ncbi:hypothetical protein [Halorubrum vacuolatum]|uniref:Uncharacterized protein n=1 Tax=Halorubrum vacuolatum TaxID=63740 RepID=A0A238WCP3_HALVU|nr:hypothetical protein [Halorubrum vacuolatum]SNR44346.1 hypothetical protein SAMN06264855_10729 [Halorubrum vacuolatum]
MVDPSRPPRASRRARTSRPTRVFDAAVSAVSERIRNRRGERIDPVPFVVSTALGFMLALSVGPIYGLSYGLSLRWSLGLSTLAFLLLTAIAYDQFVRSAPARDAGPLPAAPRFERLLYAAVGLGIVLVALTVPLVW